MAGFQLVRGRYVISKHPQAKLDYGIRLSRWLLPGDSLPANPTPVWTKSAGLTLHSSTLIDGVAYALISGGVVGAEEWASCTWTTAAGRVEIQTLWFNMIAAGGIDAT